MRLWTLVACALLLGAAAPSQAPPGNQPADKGGEAKGTEAKGAPAAPATAPAPLQQVEQAPSTKPGSKGDGQQADRPNWAEIGTFWTGVAQAVVGMLGLAGLFFTVLYAKRAWLAAKSSADADNSALAETRKAQAEARDGLRAWVLYSQPHISFNIGEKEQRYLEFWLVFVNSGQTPALNVTMVSGELDAVRPDLVAPKVPRKTVLGPNLTLGTSNMRVELGEAYKTRKPRRYKARVTYTDIYYPDLVHTSEVTVDVTYVGRDDPYSLPPEKLSPGAVYVDLLEQQAS